MCLSSLDLDDDASIQSIDHTFTGISFLIRAFVVLSFIFVREGRMRDGEVAVRTKLVLMSTSKHS